MPAMGFRFNSGGMQAFTIETATSVSNVSALPTAVRSEPELEIDVGSTEAIKRESAKKRIHPFFSNASDSKHNANIAPAVIENVTGELKVSSKPRKPSAPKLDLPVYSYKDYAPAPALVLTRREQEADDLIPSLRGPLGFDMEWRVLFRGGAVERRTALIQICDKRTILLVQIGAMDKFPVKLKELLESDKVEKIGANILNDARKLYRDFGLTCAGLVELGALARHADAGLSERHQSTFHASAPQNRTIISLANVVALYLGKALSKGRERTGNWEGPLGEGMKAYAANDAHCALMAYDAILAIARGAGQTLTPQSYTYALDEGSALAPIPSDPKPRLEGNAEPSSSSRPEETTTASRRMPEHQARSGKANTAPQRPIHELPPPIPMPPPTPQQRRAYYFWHDRRLPLERICAVLRSEDNPLKRGTVITYVVAALQADVSLPFSMVGLMQLVQMDAASWTRHRAAIVAMQRQGRGAA